MKSNYLVLVSFLLISSVFISQETIDEASLPQSGYTYRVSRDENTIYTNSAPSQSAQVWDFSSLTETYEKVPSYDSTSETPYAAYFPNSDIYTFGPAIMYSGLFGGAPVGSSGMSEGYMYWRTDATGFWTEGFRAINGAYANQNVFYNPNELIIPLPGVLNNTFNNTSQWSIMMDLNNTNLDTLYVSRSIKDFEYDAWGSLTTPYDSYTKILRLKEHRIDIDSVYAYNNGNLVYSMELSRDTTNTYFYLDKDQDYPVLTTYADVNDQVLFTEYFKQRIPTIMSVSEIELNRINLYPNPSDGNVFINSENEVNQVMVLNSQGQLIQTKAIDSQNSFDISDLQQGIYFCQINFKNNTQSQIIKVVKL